MYIRRNENNKEIKGVLPMNEARNRIRNKLFDYCYRNCFQLEFIGFTENDRIKFKSDYSYFVEGLDAHSLEIEFASFHFHKWLKRLGMKYPQIDVKAYVMGKMFNE